MSRGMRLGVFGLTLAMSLASTVPASACMFGRRRTVQTSNYAPACAACAAPAPAVAIAAPPVAVPVAPVVSAYVAPAPVAVTETRMVQRCYLAPVTTMQQQTRVENVTTYQTQFYDEAVTTMQTSAYYDPCGCGYKAVTTPVTSMVRRSRVVPVTQAITRNYLVPVTTYEQRVAMEPVTETKLYYPPAVAAVPAVANYVAPVAPVAVVAPVANYVAPAAVANYVAPAAVAAPAPVANYVAPAPVAAAPGAVAVPGAPVAPGAPAMAAGPAPGGAPGAPPQQGGADPRQYYQNPNGAQQQADNRTLVIERVIQNGQVTQEYKRYLNPGDPIPAPQTPNPTNESHTPAAPSGDSTYRWQQAPVRPMPVGRSTAMETPRLSASAAEQVAVSEFYR